MNLPDLERLLALREPARFLALDVRASVTGHLQGAHRSAHRGRGLEFQEVRPYVTGDDVRSIDWRVTARRGRLHTKTFHEERERTVWLLVDLNPGLFFGSRRQPKSAVVVWAAGLLAWTAAAHSGRVGAVIMGASETRVVTPRSRERGALSILRALVEMQPRGPTTSPIPDFNAAVLTAGRLVRPGSLVIGLSDFAAQASTTLASWTRLSAHSDGQLFWVFDPLEAHGLPDGRFRIQATGSPRTLDGSAVREQWLAAWRARELRITQLAQRCGFPLMQLDTQAQTVETLQSRLRASSWVR